MKMSIRPDDSSDQGLWDLEDLEDRSADTVQWGLVGSRAYKGLASTKKKLPPGVYGVTVDRNDDRPVFTYRSIKTDDIFDLKDPLLTQVINEVVDFWDKGDQFKKMGFLHRRGYLFYGPQGTGKSSVTKQLIISVVENDGVVLLCDNPKFLDKGLAALRQAEPKRRVMCIFEDIDAIIHRYGEDELLSILDGANMIDRVLNVATSNYPEKLDKRIISRPRRFDRVVKVGVPDADVRANFFRQQIPKISKKELDKLVKDTEGLSLAALAEVVISVYCLGNTMEKTLEILRALEEDNPSSSDFGEKGKMGFNNDDDE